MIYWLGWGSSLVLFVLIEWYARKVRSDAFRLRGHVIHGPLVTLGPGAGPGDVEEAFEGLGCSAERHCRPSLAGTEIAARALQPSWAAALASRQLLQRLVSA